MRFYNQHKLEPPDNIIAACYNQLSICSFNQNNFSEALEYVNRGLEIYDGSLMRTDIKYSLLSNKVQYLMKSSQTNYASQILDELWNSIDKIKRKTVVLNLHKFRSIILRGWGMFSEATTICEEGIQYASINGFPNRQLDLINIMGSIYLKQGNMDKANRRFHMVLQMDQKLDFPRVHADAHTYLGIMYSKQKDWFKAKAHANKAVEISRNISNDFRLARALIVLGDTLSRQMKWEQSISYYQKSVNLTRKHDFKDRQFTALSRLARCFDVLDKHEELVKCMKEILEIQSNLKITSEDEIFDFF